MLCTPARAYNHKDTDVVRFTVDVNPNNMKSPELCCRTRSRKIVLVSMTHRNVLQIRFVDRQVSCECIVMEEHSPIEKSQPIDTVQAYRHTNGSELIRAWLLNVYAAMYEAGVWYLSLKRNKKFRCKSEAIKLKKKWLVDCYSFMHPVIAASRVHLLFVCLSLNFICEIVCVCACVCENFYVHLWVCTRRLFYVLPYVSADIRWVVDYICIHIVYIYIAYR